MMQFLSCRNMNVLCLIFFLAFMPARNLHGHLTDQNKNFTRLADSEKGSQINGITVLFGYLSNNDSTKNLTDFYYKDLESAVSAYQKIWDYPSPENFDNDTVNLIATARCGNSYEFMSHNYATIHYSFFEGMPRWNRSSPITLTYAFSRDHIIHVLSLADIRVALKDAFGQWSKAVLITFVEIDNVLKADIKIGFYSGYHNDSVIFDGPGGILAHSIPPELGILHFDAAEMWVVDQEKLKASPVAFDLESVAVHEIGHILGLDHSTVNESVMYPIVLSQIKKVELNADDVAGIQRLYKPNPNFNHDHRDSSSWSTLMEARRSFCWNVLLVFMVLLFSLRLLA